MIERLAAHLRQSLAAIEAEGLTKRERLIASPQSGRIAIADAGEASGVREVVNLCANN